MDKKCLADPPFSVVVSDSPRGMTLVELKGFFSKFGKLHGGGIRFSKTTSRAFFVDYESRSGATKVVKHMSKGPAAGYDINVSVKLERLTAMKLEGKLAPTPKPQVVSVEKVSKPILKSVAPPVVEPQARVGVQKTGEQKNDNRTIEYVRETSFDFDSQLEKLKIKKTQAAAVKMMPPYPEQEVDDPNLLLHEPDSTKDDVEPGQSVDAVMTELTEEAIQEPPAPSSAKTCATEEEVRKPQEPKRTRKKKKTPEEKQDVVASLVAGTMNQAWSSVPELLFEYRGSAAVVDPRPGKNIVHLYRMQKRGPTRSSYTVVMEGLPPAPPASEKTWEYIIPMVNFDIPTEYEPV